VGAGRRNRLKAQGHARDEFAHALFHLDAQREREKRDTGEKRDKGEKREKERRET